MTTKNKIHYFSAKKYNGYSKISSPMKKRKYNNTSTYSPPIKPSPKDNKNDNKSSKSRKWTSYPPIFSSSTNLTTADASSKTLAARPRNSWTDTSLWPTSSISKPKEDTNTLKSLCSPKGKNSLIKWERIWEDKLRLSKRQKTTSKALIEQVVIYTF